MLPALEPALVLFRGCFRNPPLAVFVSQLCMDIYNEIEKHIQRLLLMK